MNALFQSTLLRTRSGQKGGLFRARNGLSYAGMLEAIVCSDISSLALTTESSLSWRVIFDSEGMTVLTGTLSELPRYTHTLGRGLVHASEAATHTEPLACLRISPWICHLRPPVITSEVYKPPKYPPKTPLSSLQGLGGTFLGKSIEDSVLSKYQGFLGVLGGFSVLSPILMAQSGPL